MKWIKRTANLKLLFEARIKVRENESGFLPELLKLREGEQCHIVRIQPLSPATQPFNIRRKKQQFRLLCDKMSPEEIEGPILRVVEGQNWNQISAASFPMEPRLMEDDSPKIEETRVNCERIEKQRGPDGVIKNMVEVSKFSWTTEKQSEENIPTSKPVDLNNNKAQVDCWGTKNKVNSNSPKRKLDYFKKGGKQFFFCR